MIPHPILDIASNALVDRNGQLEFSPAGLELVRQRLTGLQPAEARKAFLSLSVLARHLDENLGQVAASDVLLDLMERAAEPYIADDKEARVGKTGQLTDKVGSKFAQFMGKTQPGEDEEKLSDEPAIKLPIPKNIRG